MFGRTRTGRNLVRWALVIRGVSLTAGLVLGGCSSSGETKSQPATAAELDGKIDELAVILMDRKNWPRLYAEWGEAGVERLNELQPLIARKAASSPNCDRVALVGYSETRSVPKQEAVFFVDCRNEQRLWISEKDLKE